MTDDYRQSFEEYYNAERGVDITVSGGSTDDVLICEDNITMYADPSVDGFGAMDFDEYRDAESWTMGLSDEDDPRSVYVFRDPESNVRTVIDADRLENLAGVLEITPATLADSVQVHRSYPILVELPNDAHVAIAPMATDAEVPNPNPA